MTEHACTNLNHREKDIQNYARHSVLKLVFFHSIRILGKTIIDPQVPPAEIQVPWVDSGGHGCVFDKLPA